MPTELTFERGVLPLLQGLVRPRAAMLSAAIALMAVSRVSALAPPLAAKVLVDEVLGRSQMQWLLPLSAALVLAACIQAAASYAVARIVTRSSNELVADLRESVQQHVGRLPLSFYTRHSAGAIVARIMSDVESVRYVVGNSLVELVGSLVSAVAAIIVLFVLDARASAILIPPALLLGVAVRSMARRMWAAHGRRAATYADVTGRLTESVGGIRVVKAYRAEPREASVFAAGVRRLLGSTLDAANAALPLSLMNTTLTGVTLALVAWLLAPRVAAGAMTLGAFLTYMAVLGMLVGPVEQIIRLGAQFVEMLAGLNRIRGVLRERPEDCDPRRTRALGDVAGDLRFDNVDFSYEAGRRVLDQVTFHAPPGSVTALVGPSGAGKSTIMALAGGFYAPAAGTVAVDGVDLATVRLDSYRSALGVVLQDTFLFNGTIAENVAFSRPDAAERDVLEACRIARVDEFAETFEGGYDTIVGERGVCLSGGQRQRISIARAILARPRILILDEATSSLDSESEVAIHAALAALADRCTTFLVAHRLSTVRHAHQVLVVNRGRIAERGTHDALVNGTGWYARMYRAQQGEMTVAS